MNLLRLIGQNTLNEPDSPVRHTAKRRRIRTVMHEMMFSVCAKVEHPFGVIKRQFGYVKVRYRGLKKNAAQWVTLFAASNLWMVRHQLLGARG